MVQRVLIVAPHFPPTNAPDHHRVRMALPYLAEFGWQAEVLAIAPEFVEAPLDPELAETLPPDLQVHRIRAISQKLTRLFGWGSLARRGYGSLRRRGNALLGERRFTLVFFSTTQFGVLRLGPYWQRRYGVPYVLDLHDEWVGNYYRDHPEIRPPGGRFKYAISHAWARRKEREVVPRAAQIVSVSERYNTNLKRRYPGLLTSRLHVLPFGGLESDFERLKKKRNPHYFFQSGKGTNWVYVGRGGAAMHHATSAFLAATKRALDAGVIDGKNLKLHFIGTDYATGSRASPTFAPLARAYGLEEIVSETTGRIPHFTALQCLLDADALIVPGSDDPGYTASKIHPYLLAQRPLLGIFHHESSCVKILQETRAGTVVSFGSGETAEEISERIYQSWFEPRAFANSQVSDPASFRPYSARQMTQKLAAIFTAACVKSREAT